jgi:hypothetical protein
MTIFTVGSVYEILNCGILGISFYQNKKLGTVNIPTRILPPQEVFLVADTPPVQYQGAFQITICNSFGEIGKIWITNDAEQFYQKIST